MNNPAAPSSGSFSSSSASSSPSGVDALVGNSATTAGEENISVTVRFRPLNERERGQGQVEAWMADPQEAVVFALDQKGLPVARSALGFDNVFDESASNEQVYETAAQNVVESALNGINGTVFAYGQTSSGKTYTMRGVVERAFRDIFARLDDTSGEREYSLIVSYVEIYNEVIMDLLNPRNKNMQIRESYDRGVFIPGLTERKVTNMKQVMRHLAQGESNRHIGTTDMNEKSSRSHTIFRAVLASRVRQEQDEDQDVTMSDAGAKESVTTARVATLQLVDLAGSERVSHANTRGRRLKEGGHINKSLLTLGTVIRKLNEKSGKHIPYRDSKLTRMLQPALGGNSRTSIICCVTKASAHVDETQSTLGFASRAKGIRNKVRINEVQDDKAIIRQLRSEVAMLKRKVRDVEDGSGRAKKKLKRRASRHQRSKSDEPADDGAQVLREKNEELLAFQAELSAEVELLRDELSNKENDTGMVDVEKQREYFDSLQEEHQAKVDELRSQHDKRLSEVSAECSALQALKESMQEDLEMANSSIYLKIMRRCEDVAERDELARLMEEQHKAQALKEQYEAAAQNDAATKATEISRMQEEHQAVVQELHAQHAASTDSFNARIQELEQQLSQQEAEKQAQAESFAAQAKKVEDEHAEEIDMFLSRLASLEKASKSKSGELAEMHRVSQELADERALVKELRGELEEQASTHAQVKQALTRQLEQAKAEHAAHVAELQDRLTAAQEMATAAHSSLEETQQDASAKSARDQEMLAHLRQQVKQLQRQVHVAQRSRGDSRVSTAEQSLRAKLVALTSDNDKLQQVNHSTLAARHEASAELTKLHSRVHELEEKLVERDELIVELNKKIPTHKQLLKLVRIMRTRPTKSATSASASSSSSIAESPITSPIAVSKPTRATAQENAEPAAALPKPRPRISFDMEISGTPPRKENPNNNSSSSSSSTRSGLANLSSFSDEN